MKEIVAMSASPQLRTSVIYVALVAGWTGLCVYAMAILALMPPTAVLIMALIGCLFVLATGMVLYRIIGRAMRQRVPVDQAGKNEWSSAQEILISVLELFHKESSDHSARVMRMSVNLARLAGMRGDELRDIKVGALLHNIGHLAIPDSILDRPDQLNRREIAHVRQHPKIGRDLLERAHFSRTVIDIAHCHHERWDGKGYPRGLAGEEIPLSARIVSIADVWQALGSERKYRPAWPEARVLAHMRDEAGSHFDPRLIELFLANYDELKETSPQARTPARGT